MHLYPHILRGRRQPGPRDRTLRRLTGVIAVAGTLAVGIAGCGGSAKSPAGATTPPAVTTPTATPQPTVNPATAVREITQNWEKFFSKNTKIPVKIQLVENSAAMAAAVNAFVNDPRVGEASAKVTKVVVNGLSAMVTYAISLNGTVMLPNASGQAVFEKGVWKVSDVTLCSLLTLARGATGKPVPGC